MTITDKAPSRLRTGRVRPYRASRFVLANACLSLLHAHCNLTASIRVARMVRTRPESRNNRRAAPRPILTGVKSVTTKRVRNERLRIEILVHTVTQQ
jgi:hypothetical protein